MSIRNQGIDRQKIFFWGDRISKGQEISEKNVLSSITANNQQKNVPNFCPSLLKVVK